MKGRVLALGALAAAVALAAATAGALAGGRDSGPPSNLTIAYQPGLAPAPLILIKKLRLIERRYPGTTVEWDVLASGTAITDGVISGQIDIGAVGIAPMLVGWARGVNWRVLASLDLGDQWLMAKDASIRTIADLQGKRIATPTNTSTQAVVLRRMAQLKLGDPAALDNGLVAMDAPDAMQALLTGQIDAHFTSPPFEFIEQARGAHVIARSYQYFGAHSGLLAVATQQFYDAYPAFASWLYAQIRAMQSLISEHPGRAASILAEDAGGSPTSTQFKRWLVNPALTWTTRPLGLMRFASFMFRTQQLPKLPSSWLDLVFPTAHNEKGS